MKSIIKESLTNLTDVFSEVRYIFLALLFSILFYLLNFLITTYGNILSFYQTNSSFETIPFIFNMLVGFKRSILLSSLISIIILSLLTGVLFSLIFYKINLRKSISQKNGLLVGAGMFLGVFAPGCAACGLGLAAFFGLSASFATLPLKGLEISILAGIIMIIAIFRFSYTLFDNTCAIGLDNQKLKGGLKRNGKRN